MVGVGGCDVLQRKKRAGCKFRTAETNQPSGWPIKLHVVAVHQSEAKRQPIIHIYHGFLSANPAQSISPHPQICTGLQLAAKRTSSLGLDLVRRPF